MSLISTGVALGVYDGALRQYVHQAKYRGARRLAAALGNALADAVLRRRRIHGVDWVVPIPLHPARERLRGYNHAQAIAQPVGDALGRPLGSELLWRPRATRSQSRLDLSGRRDNLRGAFRAPEPRAVRGRRILLVDDVCTSGATLDAAAEALLRAGARRVDSACVAVAVPPWELGPSESTEIV